VSDLYAGKQTAAHYDAARGLPEETFRLWRDILREEIPSGEVGSVLDLGGGTGRFAGMLSEAFDCPVHVADPSEEMLQQGRARRLPRVTYERNSAERLSAADGAYDLVWMSNVFHHLEDKPGAFREIHRVLRPGGCLVVRNGTQETDRDILWKRFFPETEAFDEGRIPERMIVEGTVTGQGFSPVKRRLVYQRFAESARDYAEKIGTRGLSSLIGISDEAFTAGVQRLREWAAAQPPGEPVEEPIDIWFFRKAR
jgi:SAM-dependent methyltransferase